MREPATPLIEIVDLEKASAGLPTIRLRHLVVRAGDRYTIQGLDAGASEALIHLMTGAALPDHGEVRLDGKRTQDVATDLDWLTSLDRFGIVTERAVLLDGLSLASNLALPLTLEVDPMAPDVRQKVEELAHDVGLDLERLDQPIRQLPALERMRVHLARALAVGPQALLLEQPTAALVAAEARAFGAVLRRVADVRGLAWVAFANDAAFAEAAGGHYGRLVRETGEWVEVTPSLWQRVRSIAFR